MKSNLINRHTACLPTRARPKEIPALLHLDRNEAAYLPSPVVVEALSAVIADISLYPDPSATELRTAIARYVKCDLENVIVGNGSDEIIDLLSRSILNAGDEILIPSPTFFYYSTAALAVGGRLNKVSRDSEFKIDVTALAARVNRNTKILYIANPNNPTGTLETRETLEAILDLDLPLLVVVDECYFEYSGVTVTDLVGKYDNLFVIRSFSKVFGLAGVRLGYGIGPLWLCDALYRSAPSYSVNRLAQAAGTAALSDINYVAVKIANTIEQRQKMSAVLSGLNLKCYASFANFLLVDFSSFGLTSKDVVEHLRHAGVAVANFGSYDGLNQGCVRITVGSPSQNQICLDAIRIFVDDGSKLASGASNAF